MSTEFRYLYKYVPKHVAKDYGFAKREKRGNYTVKVGVEKIPYGVVAIVYEGNDVLVGASVYNEKDAYLENPVSFSKVYGRLVAGSRLLPVGEFITEITHFPKPVRKDILAVLLNLRYGK